MPKTMYTHWLPCGRQVLLQGFSPLYKDENLGLSDCFFLSKVFLHLQITFEIKCKKENLTSAVSLWNTGLESGRTSPRENHQCCRSLMVVLHQPLTGQRQTQSPFVSKSSSATPLSKLCSPLSPHLRISLTKICFLLNVPKMHFQ